MPSHDIALLLLDLALILVLARVLGAAARRIGQPAVVGEVVAGIALGPTLFHGAITRHLFPSELSPVLTGIADVGLVLFMFIVGYELDAALIRGRGRQAASISLGSILVPMAAGFGLGFWLATHNAHHGVVPFALFVGASMSVTAFPVLARILTDRGLHRTRLGGLAIASAAVDDVAAWSLLAVVVTIAGVPGTAQWHILFAPVYLLVMALLVRPALRRVAAHTARVGRLTPDVLAVVLTVLLLSAAATEWMGVHFIFGAFIAGAVMPHDVLGDSGAAEVLRQAILERLEQLSVLLLLPVFFVVSGTAVDLSAIDGSRLVQLLAILGVAIGGKFVGAYLGGRSAGVSNRQAGALATLMNTRGLTELIILNVGLQNHVISPPLFTLLVVMAVATTAMTGPLLAHRLPRAPHQPRHRRRGPRGARRRPAPGSGAARPRPGRHAGRRARARRRRRRSRTSAGAGRRRAPAGPTSVPAARGGHRARHRTDVDDPDDGGVARPRRCASATRRRRDGLRPVQRGRGRRRRGLRDRLRSPTSSSPVRPSSCRRTTCCPAWSGPRPARPGRSPSSWGRTPRRTPLCRSPPSWPPGGRSHSSCRGAGRRGRGRSDELAALLRAHGVDARVPGADDDEPRPDGPLLVAPTGDAEADWLVRARPDEDVGDPVEWAALLTGTSTPVAEPNEVRALR